MFVSMWMTREVLTVDAHGDARRNRHAHDAPQHPPPAGGQRRRASAARCSASSRTPTCCTHFRPTSIHSRSTPPRAWPRSRRRPTACGSRRGPDGARTAHHHARRAARIGGAPDARPQDRRAAGVEQLRAGRPHHRVGHLPRHGRSVRNARSRRAHHVFTEAGRGCAAAGGRDRAAPRACASPVSWRCRTTIRRCAWCSWRARDSMRRSTMCGNRSTA